VSLIVAGAAGAAFSNTHLLTPLAVCLSRHDSAVPSAVQRARMIIFLSHLSCHVLWRPHNGALAPFCVVACFLRTPFCDNP